MPLPPNASITDVINKLSELEGINQKTELSSVIGAPAASTDTVAQQIVKLQESKDLLSTNLSNKGVPTINTEPIDDMAVKVSQIISSNQFSTGTVTTGSSSRSYTYYQGYGELTLPFVSVSGLGFRASRIFIISEAADISITEYNREILNLQESVRVSKYNQQSLNGNNYHFKNNVGAAYVNNTGFNMPVTENARSFTWYAFP